MKQVSHQKQMTGGDGVRVDTKAKVPYQYSGTQLSNLPIPSESFAGPQRARLVVLGRLAEQVGRQISELSAESAVVSYASLKGSILTIFR
jgi:hypothetical protein